MSGIIRVETSKLRNYSARLSGVDSRLNNCNQRLDSLFSGTGILGIRSIRNSHLNDFPSRCVRGAASYLNETASSFESAEREINGSSTGNSNGVFRFIGENVSATTGRSSAGSMLLGDVNKANTFILGALSGGAEGLMEISAVHNNMRGFYTAQNLKNTTSKFGNYVGLATSAIAVGSGVWSDFRAGKPGCRIAGNAVATATVEAGKQLAGKKAATAGAKKGAKWGLKLGGPKGAIIGAAIGGIGGYLVGSGIAGRVGNSVRTGISNVATSVFNRFGRNRR